MSTDLNTLFIDWIGQIDEIKPYLVRYLCAYNSLVNKQEQQTLAKCEFSIPRLKNITLL